MVPEARYVCSRCHDHVGRRIGAVVTDLQLLVGELLQLTPAASH